jgi:glycosyltransferase involved in cell wall biosynthesis
MFDILHKSLRRAHEAADLIYGDRVPHRVERMFGRAGLLFAALLGSLFGFRKASEKDQEQQAGPLRWSDLGLGPGRGELPTSARSTDSTVWFNLTSSLRWSGPDTGIIRVERRLAHDLGDAVGSDRLRFCRWKRGAFHACDEKGRATGRCEFRPGDWLISAGLDWQHGIVDEFLRLRCERGLRIASVCHDTIPILFPQYCHRATVRNFPPYFLKLAAASEVMLCVSENTKRDAERVLIEAEAPVLRMKVIRLGDNLPTTTGEVGPEIREICRRNFMLCVSTLELRKNHRVLYQALRLMRESLPEDAIPLLVFAGKTGWGLTDLMSEIAMDPVTRGHIEILHGTSDAELAELYRNAVCVLCPSHYEGWGLPVAEALAHGKVVLASNSSSLPEIGGDLVTYLDPLNPREWAQAMEEQMTNPEARAAREAAVRSSYRPHLWSDTARQVAAVLDQHHG